MSPTELLTHMINGYVQVTTDKRMILIMSDGSRAELMDESTLNALIETGLAACAADGRYRATKEGIRQSRDEQAGATRQT